MCDKDFSERCAEKVMKRVKIDAFEIDECIENSFIGQKDYALDDNWMLKREKKLLQNSGIVYYPSIIINNVTYRGDLEADAVLKAICASYQNMPTVCSQLFPFPSHQKKSKVSIVTIFLITSLTFLLLITVLFLYKRWIKKELNSEMRYQVNAAVSQYIALTEISVSKE